MIFVGQVQLVEGPSRLLRGNLANRVLDQCVKDGLAVLGIETDFPLGFARMFRAAGAVVIFRPAHFANAFSHSYAPALSIFFRDDDFEENLLGITVRLLGNNGKGMGALGLEGDVNVGIQLSIREDNISMDKSRGVANVGAQDFHDEAACTAEIHRVSSNRNRVLRLVFVGHEHLSALRNASRKGDGTVRIDKLSCRCANTRSVPSAKCAVTIQDEDLGDILSRSMLQSNSGFSADFKRLECGANNLAVCRSNFLLNTLLSGQKVQVKERVFSREFRLFCAVKSDDGSAQRVNSLSLFSGDRQSGLGDLVHGEQVRSIVGLGHNSTNDPIYDKIIHIKSHNFPPYFV